MKSRIMEPNVVIYPPNRPMERIQQFSDAVVLYDYLLFMDINNTGEVIVGSSNITGMHWSGSLFQYQNPNEAVHQKYKQYYLTTNSISDGKFIKNSDRILLAEDNLNLTLLSTLPVDQVKSLNHIASFENGSRINQLAVWEQNNRALFCAGNSVSVMDISNDKINLLQEYRDYHTDSVTSVDTNKNQPHFFASTSVDRNACLWDDRMQVPAMVLYTNEFSSLTSVIWNPTHCDHLVVGSQAGDIYLLDIRQPKEFISTFHCFNNSVHRLSFNNSGTLAVCGDTPEVFALNCLKDDFNILYKSVEHKGIVRGLAWHNEILYTCGFDKKVIEHVI